MDNSNVVKQSDIEVVEDLVSGIEAKKSHPHIRLTLRDESILLFLLDQKFASLEAVYYRFFDQRPSAAEPVPKEYYTTRQRLVLLKRHGFIKREKVYSLSRSVFLLDRRGFQWLKTKGLAYGPMINRVDFRQFDHDLKVTYCRIALEKEGKAHQWYSDRRIRMIGFERIDGVRVVLDRKPVYPDGIFVTLKGELIAFELECSDRMLSRFEFKAGYYDRLIRDGVIKRVLWVADSDKLERDLRKVTAVYSGFYVDRYETFLKVLTSGNKL